MMKSDLVFRKATCQDAICIVEINNQYHIESNKSNMSQGFIIVKDEIKQVADYIISNPQSYYIAQTSDKKAVGFVKISDSETNNVMRNLEWLTPRLKTVFESEDTLYIEKAVVRKEFQFKGIGTFLYQSLFNNYPEKVFYAFVVKKPFNNRSSLSFHKKLNFTESAFFRSSHFFGLKNFESIMMMRIIDFDESGG